MKIVGENFDVKDYESYRFTVGRICKICKMFFINPKFNDEYRQKVSSIGGDEGFEKNKN